MILRFKTRVGALFNSEAHIDDIRTAFEAETKTLEEDVNKDISNKCTYSFLVGALITAIIFGGSLYLQSQNFGKHKASLYKAVR